MVKSFYPHLRFSSPLTLTKPAISAFAQQIGDTNPLHQNEEYAIAQGYTGIIASGPHTSAIMLGTVAKYFSQFGPMVGLEFSMYFKKGIPADTNLKIEWLIVNVEHKPRINAYLVDLRGRMRIEDRVTGIGAKGKVMVYHSSES